MTQRPDDKEWDEFQLWLQFKRERSQETTVVVSCEQPKLSMRDKAPDFRKLDRSAPNAGKPWDLEDTRMSWFAYNGGMKEKEIAEYLRRTENGVHQQNQKIKKGLVKLVANES